MAAEHQRPREAWNQTAEPFPDGTLIDLVERQVALRPGAVAVVHGDRSLTYRQLDEAASAVARRLRARGVGPETLVGLCLERGTDLVVGMVAILKAGGAYVPLDPDAPAERTASVVEDAGCASVLTTTVLAGRLGLDPARVVGLADPGGGADTAAEGDGSPERRPDQLAYVIYTSGSTGRPKGVAVEHRGAVSLVATLARRFALGPDDTWTMLHSVAFDFSVWEVWGALTSGGRVVVVPTEVTRSLDRLAGLVAAERVTVLSVTPPVFRAACEGAPGPWSPTVRLVVFGGAALTRAHLRPWAEAGPHPAVLVNMYGITETTVHSTLWEVEATDDPAADGAVPIGRPIPNTTLHVLDADLRPVAVGETGELCVGGAGVARGYLHRPELTAERFVADPADPDGARLYRSGDLARYRADGVLEYRGRLDDQVKIRGYRIEPGEVEAVLAQQPGVREAAVVARDGPGGEPRLVAYVAPATVGDGGWDGVRDGLRTRLPEYMVPAAYVGLDRLPLTVNGKVDRRALPEPAAGPAPAGGGEARTPAEELLASVWSEVLGVASVGVDDNFFDLGGHSLLAVKVVAEAEARGLEVTVADLFDRQTVRAVAAGLTPGRTPAATAAEAPVGRPPAAAPATGSPLRTAYRRLLGGGGRGSRRPPVGDAEGRRAG